MEADVILPIIAGTAVLVLLVAFIILFVILYRKAQLKFELERQEYQRAVLEAEVEMREQTLREVAQDLHDNFGQIASLIKMNLSMLQPHSEKDVKHIRDSIDLLKTLIADIRALSRDLAGKNILEAGLTGLISKDVQRVNRAGLLKINILCLPENLRLTPEVSIFVYRMFQEMLNNILKHAQASEATVGLFKKARKLHLQVNDNGVGIPHHLLQQPMATKTTSGLKNLRERCRILGANCSMESSPDKGTFIEIKIPLHHDRNQNLANPHLSGR